MDNRFDGFAVNFTLMTKKHRMAHFIELLEISAFSDTLGTALAELAVTWETVKATYRDEGLPVPQAEKTQYL